MMKVTIKNLTAMLNEKDRTIRVRQNEIEGLHRELGAEIKARDAARADLDRANDELDILRSDRDRLTTVVEVCARRLVSPQVEKMGDRRRAGWRGLDGVHQSVSPTNRG